MQQGYPPQGYQPYPPPKQSGGTPGWVLVGAGVALAVGAMLDRPHVNSVEGQPPDEQLEEDDAQRPHVDGGAVRHAARHHLVHRERHVAADVHRHDSNVNAVPICQQRYHLTDVIDLDVA